MTRKVWLSYGFPRDLSWFLSVVSLRVFCGVSGYPFGCPCVLSVAFPAILRQSSVHPYVACLCVCRVSLRVSQVILEEGERGNAFGH